MDGGFTPGQFCKFGKDDANDIKEAIIAYYENKIDLLKRQFEEL